MASTANPRILTRREFNAASINALFVGMAVTLTACSGGGGASYDAVTGPSPSTTPSPTQSGDREGAISGNHGHVAVIERALLMAGGAVVLTIDGSADHGHSVTLTAEQVSQIAGGQRITRTSSTAAVRADDGYGTGGSVAPHDHAVTFN